MSNRIKKHAPMFVHLAKAKPQTVKSIIKTCDKELMNVLCECGLNVLYGKVPISKTQRNRLYRFKGKLRELTKKRVSAKKKKTILQQGGFLGALLSPILGILGNLLGSS